MWNSHPTSLLAICLVGSVVGCARWDVKSDQLSKKLPAPKLSADSVVLDIAVIHVPGNFDDLDESLWAQVDETHLPNDLRRRLGDNGLRCALVGAQLPESLRRILEDDEADVEEGPENSAKRKSAGTWREKIQSRRGKRYKIVTSRVRDRIDVIRKDDGWVHGQTCEKAHCEFALRTYPQGDGSVRLQLTPEIHYGEAKQRYVGDNHGFVIQTQQDRLAFDDVQVETMLSLGQTLVLSCTPQKAGLGRHFFVEPDAVKKPPKLVLIRLSQTQSDDLFDPGRILAPIETTAD